MREAHKSYSRTQRISTAPKLLSPAFAAVGFSVVEHQIVQIGDQDFQRAMMEKPLVTAK